ncbi:ABC transporter permease subunit [Actinomadura fibrosa]|uniref:ABC transporter permease subunit n=1 Tax=Actinomadura fibrosa TaxID=111802 RepID=A0ABW2XN26_9ACTN|nr:ABC transporter permease subunit [Actinomadura fibrosa]
MTDAIAAEWCKLRSVRSTAYVLGTVAAFLLLCAWWSWYAGRYWDGLSAERREAYASAPPEQPLALALPICGAVLGALTVTSEYATGMIRTSLAALPRRPRLLAAKALVAGTVMLVAGLVSTTAALAAGKAVVGDRPLPAFERPFAEHVPHLLLMAVTAAAVTLICTGLGVVLRSTAATITAGAGVLFVLPTLATLLPAPWDERIWSVMPGNLADQIAPAPGVTVRHGVLPPAAASLLLVAYVAASLGAGAFVFSRRDA